MRRHLHPLRAGPGPWPDLGEIGRHRKVRLVQDDLEEMDLRGVAWMRRAAEIGGRGTLSEYSLAGASRARLMASPGFVLVL